MQKLNRQDYARQSEREMRDSMNGIRRDENDKIIHRNGKSVEHKND